MENYAAQKDTNLTSFVPTVKKVATDNKMENVFQESEKFNYIPERDKFNEKYNPLIDPRNVEIYIPSADHNEMGEFYDPNKSICNVDITIDNTTVNACEHAKNLKNKILIKRNPKEGDFDQFKNNILDNETIKIVIKDSFINIKAKISEENERGSGNFDFAKFKVFEDDDFKDDFDNLDLEDQACGNAEACADAIKKGFNLDDYDAEASPSSIDGLWKMESCAATTKTDINGEEASVFYRELVKINMGMISIETFFFADNTCIIPAEDIRPHFSTGKVTIDSTTITYAGKQKVFECIDPTTGESVGEVIDDGECGGTQVRGRHIRTEDSAAETINYVTGVDGDKTFLIVTLDDGDHTFILQDYSGENVFGHNEREEMEEEFENNQDYADIRQDHEERQIERHILEKFLILCSLERPWCFTLQL